MNKQFSHDNKYWHLWSWHWTSEICPCQLQQWWASATHHLKQTNHSSLPKHLVVLSFDLPLIIYDNCRQMGCGITAYSSRIELIPHTFIMCIFLLPSSHNYMCTLLPYYVQLQQSKGSDTFFARRGHFCVSITYQTSLTSRTASVAILVQARYLKDRYWSRPPPPPPPHLFFLLLFFVLFC